MAKTNYADNIQTFVALPIDAFQNTTQKPEFRVIKNAIIKTLSDGTLCIMDADDLNQTYNQHPIEVTFTQTVDVTPNTGSIQTPNVEPPQKPPSPIYKCPKCKEVFNKLYSYRKHMSWHRNVKKYKCEKCTAGYNVETNLKIHMAMHAEGKPTCPSCSISFQRLASLKSHLMLHQVEELYTCDECGAEFEKEEELSKHLQNHLNNTVQESNNLVCSYCNVQFEDRKSYKEHITHHVKVKKMVLSGKRSRKTTGNKKNPHVCSVCLKSFSKLSLLERHLRVHSGERPFICEHCNKGFNQKGTLQIHLSKHTGVKPFHCTLCSAKFNQKGNLRVHVEKTHTAPMPGVKTYKCPHCTCIFKKIASLNVHITKCHASSEEVGDIANVIMSRLKELEEHTVVTPDMKQADKDVAEQNKKVLNQIKKSGDVINTSFVRLAESFLDGTIRRYLVMQRKVNDVKLYICSYCNKEFKKPSDLMRHTRVHTREKPFSCKQCGASFALKSTLFYHMKTHSSDHNYLCAVCMRRFTSVRSLNLHIKKHAKSQFRCVPCNKSFPTIQRAKRHNKELHNDPLRIELKQPLLHTPNGLQPLIPQKTTNDSVKKYQCNICGGKFSKQSNLKRHIGLHSEKKFKCDQCHKSYFSSHALKEHKLYHTGIKKFGCKVCGKKFMTSSLLKRHSVSHNTSKPYVCPYCRKCFKSVLLCRKHMNVHRKEVHLEMQALKNTEIKNLSETEKTNAADNIVLPETNQVSSFQVLDKVNLIQDTSATIDQQLYQVPSNSIQIITDKDLQNPNQVQTILINCEDLQLTDTLYPQNNDTMLFNSLTELQGNNAFTIDTVNSNFNGPQSIVYNPEIISTSQTQTVDVTDLNNKILKVNPKPQKPTINLNDLSELNLFFSLDTDFAANENLNLPDINLNEVPVLNVEPQADNESKDNTFNCSKCNKTFSTQKAFLTHLRSHKDTKKGVGCHTCSYCGKDFKKHSDLVRHIRTHTGEKPFACDKCEKRFSLKSTLLTHQKTHNPVAHKQFSCVVCNSFFSSKSSLKVHMTVHTGDKAHKCNFCPMRFRTAAHRKSHENGYHINLLKKRKGKVTNLLASVAMNVLDEEQNLPTEPVAPNNLDNVLVVQEQIQFPDDLLESTPTPLPETTQFEPLIFQQLQSNILLQDNLIPSSLIQLDDGTLLNVKSELPETVEEEKPRNFECDICHKKYTSKDVLRKHKKTHGVDKKFRCTKCEKGFDTGEDLETHEKTHDGFRPHSCLYCANSFSKEHSLATHMKRIHNISLKTLKTTLF